MSDAPNGPAADGDLEFVEEESPLPPHEGRHDRIDLVRHFRADIRSSEEAPLGLVGEQIAELYAGRLHHYCGHALFSGVDPILKERDTDQLLPEGNVTVSRLMMGENGPIFYLLIAPPAISRVVASLFGAEVDDLVGEDLRDRPRLSQIDKMILTRMVTEFAGALADVLQTQCRSTATLLEVGSALVPAKWLDLTEAHVCVPFRCTLTRSTRLDIRLLIPTAAVATLVGNTLKRPIKQASETWKQRLTRALLDVELPLHCPVAEPELTLAALMDLEPGSVLPLPRQTRVRLDVDGVPFAAAQSGEQDGNRAVQLTSFISEPSAQKKS